MYFRGNNIVASRRLLSFGFSDATLGIAVGLGRDADMRLEETIEKRHIVETQREGYLLDRQDRNLELRLGVRHDGIGDDVTRRA